MVRERAIPRNRQIDKQKKGIIINRYKQTFKDSKKKEIKNFCAIQYPYVPI